MNKKYGILFLNKYKLPTISLISYQDVMKDDYIIKNGLSIRLSSRKLNKIDVNLPSIHNCYDKIKIKEFVERYQNEYDILIHETVIPDIIGSISKYNIGYEYILVFELYESFIERKKEIIKDRIIYRQYGNYLFNDECHCIKENNMKELINYIKYIPFEKFDLEFIIEDNKIIFTDFYTEQLEKVIKL